MRSERGACVPLRSVSSRCVPLCLVREKLQTDSEAERSCLGRQKKVCHQKSLEQLTDLVAHGVGVLCVGRPIPLGVGYIGLAALAAHYLKGVQLYCSGI